MKEYFDKQFLFFLCQYVFMGICNIIDTGFGNQLGIDSICVLSAYTIITWTTRCFYQYGSYIYRVILKDPKECLCLQGIVATTAGIILYMLAPVVAHLYSLTGTQYILLEQVLKIHAISIPMLSIYEFMETYVEYQYKKRQVIIGNILLYGTMIITDAYVVYARKNLSWIVSFTLLCVTLYSIYEILASGILKQPFQLTKRKVREYYRYGIDVCIDRVVGKVATIAFNVYASKLGTYLYSIHAVCYALAVFSEYFTDTFYTYLVVTLKERRAGDERFGWCKKTIKKYGVFLILVAYLACYVLLLFTHGTISLDICSVWLAVYCTQMFTILFYEPLRAYLTSEQQTKYLRYGGFIGVVVRIPIVILGYYSGLGLLPFALASGIDFGVRALYFYCCGRKFRKTLITQRKE